MIGRAEWRMEGEDRKKRAKWQKELKKGKREKKCRRWESDPGLADFDRRPIIE